MSNEFNGKVAVVTGAAKGIGAAVARLFATREARVVLADVDHAALRQVADDIEGDVIVAPTDVTSTQDMRELMTLTAETFGGIDIVTCCAGVQRYGTVDETDESTFDEVIGVNLRGAYLAGRHAVQYLRARGGGAVVHVASVQAHAAQRGVAAYAASKGGLLALTRAMAVDHAADGIRVNAVSPGSVDTPMLRHAAAQHGGGLPVEDVVASWGRMHPLGRVATTGEVAEVVAFLAGPKAAFVTGTEIVVDGGLLAGLGVSLDPGGETA